MLTFVYELPFVKMQGAGNDYIYIDNIIEKFPNFIREEIIPDLSKKISDRHFGIGSDGLIMILPSEEGDFRMRIFNADGSEAQMCGNGIRCVAKYVFERKLTDKTSLKIETLAGIKQIDLIVKEGMVESIKVDMGVPILDPSGIPVTGEISGEFFNEEITVLDKTFNITAVGMGNPHCVIFVEDLSDELINTYGPLIESHPIFPEKTNVEFVKVIDGEHIEMRVWERGSQETMACGTGACAASVASRLNGFTGNKVEVKLPGGKLRIEINQENHHVYMSGGADFVAKGVFFYETDI